MWGEGGVLRPITPDIVGVPTPRKTFPWPTRSLTVRENNIDPAVKKILIYRQTDIQPVMFI